MLDSMIRNPRPTIAEANDVANAVLDGTDAVMLSGETAKGLYPLRSVETMKRIVSRAEKEIEVWERPQRSISTSMGVPDAVSSAAVLVARQMNASSIISMTQSGSTAKMVSRHRPPAHPRPRLLPDVEGADLYWESHSSTGRYTIRTLLWTLRLPRVLPKATQEGTSW